MSKWMNALSPRASRYAVLYLDHIEQNKNLPHEQPEMGENDIDATMARIDSVFAPMFLEICNIGTFLLEICYVPMWYP